MTAYLEMGPFRDDDESGQLEAFMGILGSTSSTIYALVGDGEDGELGWSAVFDVDRAPEWALPWLAQFVGVSIAPEMSEVEARDAIRSPNNFTAGTVAAIKAAIEPTLEGTKRIIVHERTPDHGHLYVRTIASETPDEARTLAAILRQKPWHLVLDYDAATGLTYIDVDNAWSTYAGLESEGLTYQQLAETLP